MCLLTYGSGCKGRKHKSAQHHASGYLPLNDRASLQWNSVLGNRRRLSGVLQKIIPTSEVDLRSQAKLLTLFLPCNCRVCVCPRQLLGEVSHAKGPKSSAATDHRSSILRILQGTDVASLHRAR